jgi:hypothetical protein
MELTIGGKYEVTCARLRWREDGRVYYVPVIDHLHADSQFGFSDQHYHIDGRFEMDARMRHYFRLADGYTSSVVLENGTAYVLIDIVIRTLACTGNLTGLRLPNSDEHTALYQRWYGTYVGRECKGRRCPHFGTEMIVQDGMLVCPMHNLTADPETLLIQALL